MPELPEVETTRRGIAPLIEGRCITAVVVRQPKLRWPVPADLAERVVGAVVSRVERRSKYLLLRVGDGTLLIHLGMSGSLRIVPASMPAGYHDHVDLLLDDGRCLRLRDPRRFGSVLWQADADGPHPLLAALGPEPLGPDFDGDYLHRRAAHRRIAIKPFLMDAKVVVGVGNIYASESLFRAGIDPRRAAGRVSLARYRRLASAVREVLAEAIEAGGTTLRDFADSDGQPGYFRVRLNVYGRAGEACPDCDAPIRVVTLGQRSTFYCPECQR